MRLRWTPAAADDLESIYDYVAEHYPSLAQPTMRLLYDTVRSLRRFPRLGRVGAMPETRELIVSGLPYIIVYRLTPEVVQVLRIWHGAQDRRAN